MREARDTPKFTDMLPVFGRGALRLSEVKIRIPKIKSPKKEMFLYLMSVKTRDAMPATRIMKTYNNKYHFVPSSFNSRPLYSLNTGNL